MDCMECQSLLWLETFQNWRINFKLRKNIEPFSLADGCYIHTLIQGRNLRKLCENIKQVLERGIL